MASGFLITSEPLPNVLAYLSLSALAVMLVHVRVRLIGLQHLAALWRTGKGELLTFFVQWTGVVLFNLFAGTSRALLSPCSTRSTISASSKSKRTLCP